MSLYILQLDCTRFHKKLSTTFGYNFENYRLIIKLKKQYRSFLASILLSIKKLAKDQKDL